MEPIPEALVEKTWQEAVSFTAARADREMQKLAVEQPDLLAFILEVTKELDRDARELGTYLFFNVCRMFHKAYGKRLPAVSPEAILECFEKNSAQLEILEETGEETFKQVAAAQLSAQPHVMGYVVKAMFEETEDEPLEIEDEDIGYLYMVLKTVVDVLDHAATPPQGLSA